MLHAAACNTDRRQAFLSHALTALETQECPTWLALDTALKQASEAFYPKRRTVELRPWQEMPVQVALKHVWQARAALRTGRNGVCLGLRGVLLYWKRVTHLRRTTRQLRRQSNAQRRLKWCRKLQDAEDALHRHDAHHFFQVITQLAPKQSRSRVQFGAKRAMCSRLLKNCAPCTGFGAAFFMFRARGINRRISCADCNSLRIPFVRFCVRCSRGKLSTQAMHALPRGRWVLMWLDRCCSATFSSCSRLACLLFHHSSRKPGFISCPSQARPIVSRATFVPYLCKALPAKLHPSCYVTICSRLWIDFCCEVRSLRILAIEAPPRPLHV